MVSAAKTGPQDMPPSGGYGPIQTERIKIRTFMTGHGSTGSREVGNRNYTPLTIGLVVASQIIGWYVYRLNYKKIKNEEIELRSARFALMPMLLAERDRAFLKQLRKNRDDERDLMKNDPDWEVGTYYGEPIYRTRPIEEFREPGFFEFYAHSSWIESISQRMLRRHFC